MGLLAVKSMKRIGPNLIIILMIISLTGCSLPTAPSNLIKPPYEDEASIKLKQTIENLLPAEARLTIPASQNGNSKAFFEVDINEDDSKEIIAFYKLGNEGFRHGFMVLTLDNNESWVEIGRVDEYAEDIAYVDFTDLTGDNLPELLVGWSGGGSGLNNELAIFTFNNKELVQLNSIAYSHLTIGDLDGDSLAEIAISKHERMQDIPNAVVEVYKYENHSFNLAYMEEFEASYPGELIIGKASKENKGLFVETYLGAHSAASYLFIYKDEKLVNILKGERDYFSHTFKPYPLPSKDVNGDGIIEIGIHREPPGSEDLPMVEIPWVENWYQWDGEDGLEWVVEIYADYGLGYEWIIPSNWRDKYSLTRENTEEISRVEFYDLNKHKHKIFTLLVIDTELWNEEENQFIKEEKEYRVLEENQLLGKLYVGILPEPKTCRCLMPITISLEQISAQFRITPSSI